MRDDHIDLCGQVDFTRTEAMPLLERETQFCFACAGCGDCCRGREDIVLSGFDLWRIAARLRLPPQIVARGYCRASIGQVSHLPVLRLAPVKENRSNCPFLTENHCAIHDAEPLVCALYPLAQEISREGQVSYFLQPTGCGGQVIEARVQDYLSRYDVPVMIICCPLPRPNAMIPCCRREIINTPITVPPMEASPPTMDVPPITQPAIASLLY